ncbi:hypothetical protein PDN23_14285 [Bacillus cereus]|nr:hypothetical protein [Bacillus cereus]
MTGNEFIERLSNLFTLLRVEGDPLKFRVAVNEERTIDVSGGERVLQIFDEIRDVSEDDLIIYYKDQQGNEVAEVAVLSHHLRDNRGEIVPELIEDSVNEIKYEMTNVISDYYIVWLFGKFLGAFSDGEEQENFLINRGRYITSREKFGIGFRTKTSLLDMMRNLLFCDTLKITKQKDSKISLKDTINSFIYTYMCNMNGPIKIYSVEEVFGILSKRDKAINNNFQAPKRIYNANLLDYYNLAVSSIDPFVSFISYYHIIEYFFDEVFREQQINNLKKSITSPRFNYKDEEQLYNIIKTIIKDNHSIRENGSGNEKQSMNYVLAKYIYDIDEFKLRLNNDELAFYQNNIVSFSRGNVINWERDKTKIIKDIVNRIYATRNALIHSKSSKKEETYHPYLHKNDLEKEINLIKALAECIIENDSELIGK